MRKQQKMYYIDFVIVLDCELPIRNKHLMPYLVSEIPIGIFHQSQNLLAVNWSINDRWSRIYILFLLIPISILFQTASIYLQIKKTLTNAKNKIYDKYAKPGCKKTPLENDATLWLELIPAKFLWIYLEPATEKGVDIQPSDIFCSCMIKSFHFIRLYYSS